MTDKFGIVLENDPNENLLRMQYAQYKETCKISRAIRDYSRPVDEYEFNVGAFAGPVNIVPAFSSAERIESITALLPVGITGATLQLGKRFLPLYSGAATTLITTVNLTHQGIIVAGSDDRVLTFTGAPTTGFYVALAGHTLENR